MRAFAHLFGLFHLHQDKRLIQLKRDGKGFVFEVIKKNGSDREHKLYWKYLAEHRELKGDPFFYPNREDIPQSDGSHRNRANYADHLNSFPMFRPLSEEFLARRIQKIAEIEFSAVPFPTPTSSRISLPFRFSLTTASSSFGSSLMKSWAPTTVSGRHSGILRGSPVTSHLRSSSRFLLRSTRGRHEVHGLKADDAA